MPSGAALFSFMASRKTYRRQSKKNPWRNTLNDREYHSPDWKKYVGLLLILTIPVMCVGLSFGLLTRAADVYQFNFRATQAIELSHRYVAQDDVVKLLSDFMSWDTDEFVLMQNVDYEPENVFSEEDQQAMLLYRRYADRVLIAGIAGALCTAILFILMVRWNRKDRHRACTYAAAVPLAAILVFQFAAKSVPHLRAVTYGRIIPVEFPEGDFLVYIAQESFGRQLAVFEAIAALILYFLLIYVTLRVAGKDRLFRGGSSLYEGPKD